MVNLPTGMGWTALPVAPALVAPKEESALPGADHDEHIPALRLFAGHCASKKWSVASGRNRVLSRGDEIAKPLRFPPVQGERGRELPAQGALLGDEGARPLEAVGPVFLKGILSLANHPPEGPQTRSVVRQAT